MTKRMPDNISFESKATPEVTPAQEATAEAFPDLQFTFDRAYGAMKVEVVKDRRDTESPLTNLYGSVTLDQSRFAEKPNMWLYMSVTCLSLEDAHMLTSLLPSQLASILTAVSEARKAATPTEPAAVDELTAVDEQGTVKVPEPLF